MERFLRALICVHLTLLLLLQHHCNAEKYRVCVVDGRGGFKRAGKYCPTLDKALDSKVECVIGNDRLDCLRRMSKGRVDFAVLTPEDLVAAINSQVEVLLTSQMNFTKEKYEYKVVAVVNDQSGIRSKHDLRDKQLCHPGYGYETDWNHILANYLEVNVVPQTCDESLSLTENRIKSSSEYFKAACKAGPWVYDPDQDAKLKQKYSNLCALCDRPEKCAKNDKYWGRQGPLYCLTDGVGDITWARLDDVLLHFAPQDEAQQISSSGYSYLCQDGTTQPVNSTTNPCVWVVKPWPVIVSRSKLAQEVRHFFNSTISNQYTVPSTWQNALINLIQNFKQDITPLDNIQPIETYLEEAPGFLSANSFPGCHPPRTIRVCSTTNVANTKCAWMRSVANVYGIEPDIDCIKANNVTHCMEAIQVGVADVVLAPPDYINIGRKSYDLKTLLYETVDNDNKYITVAVVKAESHYRTLEDLRGAKACFPKYDGIAYNTLIHSLSSRGLFDTCPYDAAIRAYFSRTCIPGLKSVNSMCKEDHYDGDYGALRCLANEGDVAFISQNSLENFFNDPKVSTVKMERHKFRVLCEQGTQCHYSWANVAQLMVARNKSETWYKDTVDVFYELDYLFGRNYKTVTTPFTLFGIYDGQSNVLFHDATLKFSQQPYGRKSDRMHHHYNNLLDSVETCKSGEARTLSSTWLLGLIYFVVFYIAL